MHGLDARRIVHVRHRRNLRSDDVQLVDAEEALFVGSSSPVRDLDLMVRQPRCMSCGGELRAVPKDQVAGRIPPRTARWKDEYFVCSGCDRLFWQGTHWERIARRLAELASS